MKAAYFDATGSPDVIRYGDLPMPEPQAGEVCVKVSAAAVNPIDTYIRGGMLSMTLPKPFIPGCDLAGTVEKLGPNTTLYKVGDRVWGSNQGLLGRQGTFCEYACVREEWLYPTPPQLLDADAAANALVGITAWLGLIWRAKVQQNDLVVVSGGTGGVGAMVVQMAKACGAKVVAIVGDKVDVARSLGADGIVSYRTEKLADSVKSCLETVGNGRKADVWFETQPPTDLERTFDCMALNGRVILMAGRAAKPVWPNGAFYPKNLQLFGFAMFNVAAEIQRRAALDMNRWMAEGKLKSLIGARFPLSQAADAHRLQEENTLGKKGTLTGKIVVIPGS